MIVQGKEWYDVWFDSPYYHMLYKHRDDTEAQFFLSKLIEKLNLSPEEKVLDLACGKGRHSRYLNAKGLDVVGIDLSEESIAHNKSYENDRLKFVRQDMRDVYREGYFDVILNLFTSFGYFEKKGENNKAIHAVSSSLKPKGKFLIDFLNVEKAMKSLVPDSIYETDGVTFSVERKVEKGYIVKRISFADQGKDFVFQEKVKAISYADFQAYFRNNGLVVVDVFGDYALNPFSEEKSDRLIILAEKVI